MWQAVHLLTPSVRVSWFEDVFSGEGDIKTTRRPRGGPVILQGHGNNYIAVFGEYYCLMGQDMSREFYWVINSRVHGRIRTRGFDAGLVLWPGPIPDDATVIQLNYHDTPFTYTGTDPFLQQMAERSVRDQSWDRWVYSDYILELHPRDEDDMASFDQPLYTVSEFNKSGIYAHCNPNNPSSDCLPFGKRKAEGDQTGRNDGEQNAELKKISDLAEISRQLMETTRSLNNIEKSLQQLRPEDSGLSTADIAKNSGPIMESLSRIEATLDKLESGQSENTSTLERLETKVDWIMEALGFIPGSDPRDPRAIMNVQARLNDISADVKSILNSMTDTDPQTLIDRFPTLPPSTGGSGGGNGTEVDSRVFQWLSSMLRASSAFNP